MTPLRRCGPEAVRTLAVAGCVVLLGACGFGEDEPEPTATPDDLFVIVTPTPGTPPRTDAEAQRYVVQPGDSLTDIADRFGVTMEQIQEANDISDPDSIVAGQELTIPAPE